MNTSPPLPVALSVAGSDPSGGAGVQADLKVFHQHRVFGAAVISVLTVQNTRVITRTSPVESDLVRAQLEAVLEDLPVGAMKTGALGYADTVRAVAEVWRQQRPRILLVVDPVLSSTSGRMLLEEDAIVALREELLPCASLITPNLAEAEALSGLEIRNEADMERAARILRDQGAEAVLLKGGHLEGDPVDLLVLEREVHRFGGSREQSRHDHGTGCALSASITAGLAAGIDLQAAVGVATRYVKSALRNAPGLGAGRGPLDLWATPDTLDGEQAE